MSTDMWGPSYCRHLSGFFFVTFAYLFICYSFFPSKNTQPTFTAWISKQKRKLQLTFPSEGKKCLISIAGFFWGPEGQRCWQFGDWWLRSFPGGTMLDSMISDPRHRWSGAEVGQLQRSCMSKWTVCVCVVFLLKAMSPTHYQDCWMVLSTWRHRTKRHLGTHQWVQDE